MKTRTSWSWLVGFDSLQERALIWPSRTPFAACLCLLLACIVLTGCRSTEPQYASFQSVPTASTAVTAIETTTITNTLDHSLLEAPT